MATNYLFHFFPRKKSISVQWQQAASPNLLWHWFTQESYFWQNWQGYYVQWNLFRIFRTINIFCKLRCICCCATVSIFSVDFRKWTTTFSLIMPLGKCMDLWYLFKDDLISCFSSYEVIKFLMIYGKKWSNFFYKNYVYCMSFGPFQTH